VIPPYEPKTLSFRKATASGGSGGNCLEVAKTPDGGRAVRDSKDHGRGPLMYFTAGEWAAFLNGAKDGEFDD
jgi:Domain of unknown function (DUF397)